MIRAKWEHAVGLLGLALLLVGQYMGLFVSPREEHMGEVARILYVHVPAAWLALVTFCFAFVGAAGFLATGRRGFDHLVAASVEVGVVMTALLLTLGSIFARPTWGVWWVWDARLTSTAVMVVSFIGVMLLRALVLDPDRRAVWSAAATLLSFINIPIVYFSVRWWNTLHQLQSSPDTVDGPMVLVLRLNAFAFLFLTIWFVARRWRIEKRRALAEAAPPLPPEVPQ